MKVKSFSNKKRKFGARASFGGEFFSSLTSFFKKPVVVVVTVLLAALMIVGAIFIGLSVAEGNRIDCIIILSMPEKVVYYEGDEFDSTGLSLGLVRKNGKMEEIDLSACTISGFDSSKPVDSQRITVRYQDTSISFSVIVYDVLKPAPVLASISLERLPQKTEYKLGERLSTSGGVILCEYQDGSTFRISLVNGYVYGYSKITEPGEYQLTVKYKENGIVATCTFTITVTE